MNEIAADFRAESLEIHKTYILPDPADGQIYVTDANLVFSGDYSRSGPDLHIIGADGQHLVVPGYFGGEDHASVISPEGAVLTGDVVSRLVGPQFAGEYAGQTAPNPGATIGRVESMLGTVTATRADGSSVELKVGDVVHEGDIITTAPASSVGLTFSDQTVLSLSENSRMVLDQYSFSTEGTTQSSNSMLVNVIEGTFVFIAGLIAPTGKMRVETPVASMGIRGTTGVIEVEAKDGATGFKLISDPDGGVGHFDLYNKKSGELIRAFTEPGDSLLVRNAGGETADFNAALDASQKSAVSQAFTAYSLGQARIDRGDDPVGNPTGPNGAPPPPTPGAPRRGEIDGMQRHAGLMPIQPLIALLPEVTFDPETGEQIFLLTDAERPPLQFGTFITSAPDALVIEAGLPVTGSNPTSPGESFTGELTSTGGQGGYTYEIVGSGTGLYGTLQLGSDGTYTYTLITPIQDQGGNDGANVQVAAEVFTYRVTDANGNTATGQILINITDDVPVARADAKTVVEGGIVTGNVLTDGTADAFGADGAASGGGIVGVRAAGDDLTGAASGNVGLKIEGRFGELILNADGSYSYNGKADAVPVGGATDVFVYTIQDGDGDLSTTTLTVTLSDSGLAAVSDSDAQVSEAGLPTGSTPSSTAVIADGTLAGSVTGGTGSYTYAIVGSQTSTYGTIVLNPDTGAYTYTLNSPVSNTASADSATDTFIYRATDANDNTVTGEIIVRITDDRPIVHPESLSITEGTKATYNAFSTGFPDSFGADDKFGVVGVRLANDDITTPASGNLNTVIGGKFGTLIMGTDGAYTYQANPNAIEGSKDVFVFTVQDGDGDLATTTLTAVVNKSGLVALTDTDANVSEAALNIGSNPSSTAETDSDNTLVGRVTSSLGPTYTYTLEGSSKGQYGTITLMPTGTYSYTLTSPASNTTGDGVSATDTFTYRATDIFGNTVTGQIVVTIADDAPIARADVKSVVEGGVVSGDVLSNDAFGADGAASGGGIVGVRAAGDDLTGAAIGNVGLKIQGRFGDLILSADGSYTYDGDPNLVPPDGAKDTFVYTIKDGDGDLSTTTLTINLSDSGLKAETDRDGQVTEAALPNGSSPSSAAVTDASNTLAGSVTGGTGAYTYALEGPNATTANGRYGTITLNTTTGEYSYTLTTPATNTGADGGSASDSFTYRATDANGNTVTGEIVVNVLDDVPVARPDSNSGPEATISRESVNIVIVLDRSGSMSTTVSGSQTRIDLARQAISNLLDTLNASATKVNVLVVDFADSAQTSGWRTIDGAKTYLSGLSAGGGTNYDAALERVQTAFNTGKPTAEQNITVFLSDGEPTTGGGITTNGDGSQVSQAEWEAFLTAQDMPSFAIGIGSATVNSLQPIAFDPAAGTQPADTPVVYTSGNEGALLNALSGLVVSSSPNSFSGNVLSGQIGAGGDTFGADGPAAQHIVAATFLSATGTTVVFRADAVGSTADVLRLIGLDGSREVARLDVNTKTGAYTLTLLSDFPHAIAGTDAVLKFAYTIQDGDGDQSTSSLTITIGDQTGGASIAAAAFAFSPAEQVGFTDSTGHVIGPEGTAVIHVGETARFDVQDVSGNSNLKFGALAVSQQFIASQDQPITMTVAAIDGQGGIVQHVTVKAFAIVSGQWAEQTSVTSTANDDGTVTLSGLQTGLHLTIQSDVAFQALEFSNEGVGPNSNAGFKFTDVNIDLLDGPIDSSGSDSILLTSANIGHLIDGGAGQDTLRLVEPNFVLDFDALAANNVRNIEAIDMRGNGAQELHLSLGDVIDLSVSPNLDFVAAAALKGIAISPSENLLVSADSSDQVHLSAPAGSSGDSWVKAEGGPVTVGSHDYNVYNYVSGSHILASVAVDGDPSVHTTSAVS